MVTSAAQIEELRAAFGVDARRRVGGVRARHAGGRAHPGAARRCSRRRRAPAPAEIPDALDETYPDETSTQEAFGRVLAALGRLPAGDARRDGVRRRRGHHAPGRLDEPQGHLLSRRRGPIPSPTCRRRCGGGRAPTASTSSSASPSTTCSCCWPRSDSRPSCPAQTLLPIGTLYDPFITRGLDALYHALYCGARFVVVGHAVRHQPGARGRRPPVGDHARHRRRAARPRLLRAGVRARGGVDPAGRAARRGRAARESLPAAEHRARRPAPGPAAERRLPGGGARRRLPADRRAAATPGWQPEAAVHLFADRRDGAVPQVVAAAQRLPSRARSPSVFVVTSPDRLYRGLREPRPYLETLVGADEEDVPVVSVLDGHSHALAFLGGALGVPQLALGVDDVRPVGHAAGSLSALRNRRRRDRRAAAPDRVLACSRRYTSGIPMATLAADRKSALRRELEGVRRARAACSPSPTSCSSTSPTG